MSDVAATNCGCDCGCGCGAGGNGCNLIWLILILCCCCGGGNGGCFEHNNCGCDLIWLILILCCCGGPNNGGGFFCCSFRAHLKGAGDFLTCLFYLPVSADTSPFSGFPAGLPVLPLSETAALCPAFLPDTHSSSIS